MDKHSKRSASIFRYPVLIAFTLFFAGLFVLDLVTPDRAYSELENTTLSQRPSLSSVSADGLNKFFTAYTKYVKDQVVGRDNWVALQSTVETKVMQKEQSGGILLGKQHMMFPRTYGLVSSETRTLPKNTAALEALCQRYPGKVNVMLVPAASAIYPENVPAGAPLLDEDCYLDSAFRCRTGRRRPLCGRAADPHRPQRRIYLLPHRPPLDEHRRLLRLQAALRRPGPYAF